MASRNDVSADTLRAALSRKRLLTTLLALVIAAPAAAGEKPDTSALVKGNTRFALELYGRLRGGEGNLFLSPFSVSTALAMTSAGARGRTLEQMQEVLHLPGQKALHPANAALLRLLKGEGKKRGYRLSAANALWGQKGYPFLPAFLKLTSDSYGAGLREADFSRDPEAARREINAWAEKETEGKIKDLLRPGVIDAMTRLVLANAVYFKGDWASQFKKDRTREGAFHLSTGKTVKAPLMSQTARFGLLDAGDFQALEMPYAGKDLSMVVLLPRKADGLAALERSLTPASLAGWLKKLRQEQVEVTFPRFRVTSEFQLREALSGLGMPLAFSREADFSGMNGGGERLSLSAVAHKAFVDVNEEGTEAAAATGTVVKTLSLPVVRVFRADRPFVFLIREGRSGSILFLGRLANPG
jgi:serpin B